MRYHKFQIAILLLLISTLSYSQKLDHVLGEVIVEVRSNNDINTLVKDLSSTRSYRSAVNSRQLISEPMNLWVLSIDPNIDNEIEFMESVITHRSVLLAQKNHITQLRQTIPDDPRFDDQWQYINLGQNGGTQGADIDIDLAWNHTTGGTTISGDEIVVCVVDNGINEEHPDLGDNLWINDAEIPNNGIDDDGNGYVDDVRGWDVFNQDDNVYQGGGHGTPVAGIIGAQGNNGVGVAGVNWDVKLMIVVGGGPESNAIASYAYPYTMRKMYNESNGAEGAFVVSTNSSWGVDTGQPDEAPIWCNFYNLLGEEGILSFGATANANFNIDAVGDLPTACGSDFLVSVTNINRTDAKVNSAGFGLRTIDLGAFGESTLTLSLTGYGGFGGTSGATPHVAGTAALLYAADCEAFMTLVKADPAQAALVVKDAILHGVDPNQSLENITTTGGRLNTNNALENLLLTCGACAPAQGLDLEITEGVNTSLSWFDNGNLGDVSIRYKEIDATDWIEIENVTSGLVLQNLEFCNTYEYQSKTTCSPTDESGYTYSRIFSTEGCCDIPPNINVTLEGETATITWGEMFGASNFRIEYRNVDDSDWIEADLGTDNTFSFSGVEECQSFEIRLKTQCSITSNESEYSEIIIITGECGSCTSTDYCEFSTKNVNDEWISEVSIDGVFSSVSGPGTNGYANFIGQVDISIQQAESYDISMTPDFSGQTFPEFFTAAIDFNQDSEFSDDEIIFISAESTTAKVTGNFVVPADALLGNTRLRVVMRFNVGGGPCDNNGFTFGEIEDYCINILEGVDCPSDYNAIVLDSTETSLVFEIPEDERTEMYLLDYRTIGSDEFTSISSLTNVITLEDLDPCTSYEYRTSVICLGDRRPDTEIASKRTVCGPLSTETSSTASVSIFPNPVSHKLTIEVNNGTQELTNVTLRSIGGKRIIVDTFSSINNDNITIDVSNLQPGIYLVDMIIDGKRKVEKIVKR